MNAQKVNADISALLRARHTLLWIASREELRVERALIDICATAKYEIRYQDCDVGIVSPNADGTYRVIQSNADPTAALEYIRRTKDRAVYVMRDLHKWIADPVLLRKLRNIASELQKVPANEARAIVVLTPSSDVPVELSPVTPIEYPLPDRGDVGRILDEAIKSVPESIRGEAIPEGKRDAAIDSAIGLTAEGVSNCYAKSLVTTPRKIDPALVMAEKKRAIKARGLTVYDPDPRGLDAIGGYELLKQWAVQRKVAFSAEAREFGLPAPKGVLLVGPPGTGKSLTAKSFGVAFGVPVLRGDIGGTKSKFVGESESNIREMLRVAEAMAPCVLWLDEIEKALAGATGPQGDGGVSADALGTILSWMQERTSAVFVVATANDVRGLPPEFLRKGRFDEMFFIDLPNTQERVEVIRAALAQYGRNADAQELIDLKQVAVFTDGFTGAEIAALVPDALFTAFADGKRPLTTDDLRKAAETVVPISKTASERLTALRDWAKTKARPASKAEAQTAGTVRSLDL